jgi:AraC family transcriptional regulator
LSEQLPSSVRAEWLYENARRCQEILCEMRATSLAADSVVAALTRLPEAETPLERLVQQGLIADIVVGCIEDVSEPRSTRMRSYVRRVLATVARPAALLDSPARRAAILIRENCSQPLNATLVARKVGCETSRLRRRFKLEIGMQMRAFHTVARVAKAVNLFADGPAKTSAIARLVGYQSDKDLYRALRDVAGLRPSALRTMSPQALRDLASCIGSELERPITQS